MTKVMGILALLNELEENEVAWIETAKELGIAVPKKE